MVLYTPAFQPAIKKFVWLQTVSLRHFLYRIQQRDYLCLTTIFSSVIMIMGSCIVSSISVNTEIRSTWPAIWQHAGKRLPALWSWFYRNWRRVLSYWSFSGFVLVMWFWLRATYFHVQCAGEIKNDGPISQWTHSCWLFTHFCTHHQRGTLFMYFYVHLHGLAIKNHIPKLFKFKSLVFQKMTSSRRSVM